MPNCYQYFKDGAAVPLGPLDDAICAALGQTPHERRFYWAFEMVSWRVAVRGRSLQEIAADQGEDGEIVRVAQWLIDNGYTTDAWVEIGKR